MPRVLSNGVRKAAIDLSDLPPGAVIIDQHGHAWQSARRYSALGSAYASGYWYRAYDGVDASEVSTWDLACTAGKYRVVWDGADG